MSTLEGYHNSCGKYNDLCGGSSVHQRDIIGALEGYHKSCKRISHVYHITSKITDWLRGVRYSVIHRGKSVIQQAERLQLIFEHHVPI